MPSYQPDKIPQEWRDLLLLIPGYDSIATAGDAWFDADAAQQAIDFFPACLTHVEGALAGKPFILEPWQKSFIANLFGWKRKDEFGRTVRRYRETLLYCARKNGKTPVCSGLALLVFFTDDERGQQGYIAAGEKERLYGLRWPVDDDFLAALDHGLPDCAGVALGFDRLVMLATGASHIEDVLWLPVR